MSETVLVSVMSSISLQEHVKSITTTSHIIAVHWIKDTLLLALSDGHIAVIGRDGSETRLNAHPDAGILVATSDGTRFITGGDDGRVVACDATGQLTVLADHKGRWIDAVAGKADGAFAFSMGREIIAIDNKRKENRLSAPSTARGLAFAPKGYRLAASHYNGVTLWFPNTNGLPEMLDWKGSHLDVVWSPDGRFVVTSMQENALHGWRVQDRHNMRMTGYPAKTRSFAWSHDGKWLATSGADAAIVWPFDNKDGPMGKAPRECGVRPSRVSSVSFHPQAPVLAVGYDDGCILLVRFTDASELLVRPAISDSAVSALGWSKTGMQLAYGCIDGQAGLLTLPAA